MAPYSRAQLLAVRTSQANSRVPSQACNTLKELGIGTASPTHRGATAGQSHKRTIEVRVTNRKVAKQNVNKQTCQLSNYSSLRPNLITIPKISQCGTSSKRCLKVCSLNVRSVKNKTLSLCDFILTNDFDVIALTETWLGTKVDKACIAELVPTGFGIKHVPRPNDRSGGGVAVVYKLGLSVKLLSSSADKTFTHFEHMDCQVSVDGHALRLSVVYRPPPSNVNNLRNSVFFQEWPVYLEGFTTSQLDIIILGDMNFHLDSKVDSDAGRFISILQSHNMTQHVVGPTHIKGHTLDVAITKDHSRIIKHLVVSDPALCDFKGSIAGDHYAVTFSTTMSKPPPVQKEVTYRKLRAIDIPTFKHDIVNTPSLAANTSHSAAEVLEAYNDGLRKLIDAHAPICTRTITLRAHAPWYNEELRNSKRRKRKLERQWRLSQLEVHRQIYRDFSAQANKLLRQVQTEYYSQKVEDSAGNKQSLFRVTKQLMGEESSTPLPDHSSPQELAERFSTFFLDKISAIRDDLDKCDDVIPTFQEPVFDGPQLSDFTPTTEDELRKLVMSSGTKSCDLDPIPTWLLKECLDELLPILTTLLNASLLESTVPSDLKHAHVRPLLKKSGLDTEVLKSYRPVSNLTFVSKLLEKVVAARLDLHLEANDLICERQSAYRKSHSTETALLKVSSDILTSLDEGQSCLLILLDLSAAFDTLDHDIMIKRLSSAFGITGSALNWFISYLSGRFQSVIIEGQLSTPKRLEYGVPQGSVLGPKLYSAYVKPLGDMIDDAGAPNHLYADDTQLYKAFNPTISDEQGSAVSSLQEVCVQTKSWMAANKLKLNAEKTEVLAVTPKHKPALTPITLHVGNTTVTSTSKVRDLGVIIDGTMSMEEHVSSVVRSAYAQLSKIARIRGFLTPQATKSLMHAMVTSRIDYCNSLLYGLPRTLLNRLQQVQNACARVVMRIPRRQHITPVLKELHWLPVEKRVQFKMLVHTFRAIHGDAPSYIRDLVTVKQPARQLRSASEIRLTTSSLPKTVTYGDRSFKHAAPSLWNSLPSQLKNVQSLNCFKKALKTHFFKQMYD